MNNKQLIAEYDYKDKHFLLYAEGAEKEKVHIQYYQLSNVNQLFSNLSDEELLVASEVLKNITISNDFSKHIDVGTTLYRGKKFQMFFDPVSHLRYFYEISNNNYIQPNNSDLEYLNDTFNNERMMMDENIYQAEVIKPAANKLRKKIKIGSVILTVFLTLDTVFLTAPSYLISENSEIDLTQTIIREGNEFEESLDKYALHNKLELDLVTGNVNVSDILISSINSNEHLSEFEKEFVTSNQDLFNENALYIDLPNVDQRLSSLDINYVNNFDEVSNYYLDMTSTAGFYVPGENMIYIMPDFHNSKEVLYHEFLHSFGTMPTPFGFALSEAINETMSIEYFPDDTRTWSTYQNPRLFLKMLTEIVGPDTFKEFKFKSNIDIIVSKLNSIIDDEELPYSLISAIDDCQIYADYIARNSNSDLLEETLINYQNSSNTALDIISQYFEHHKGYKMDDDLIMTIYANEIKKVGMEYEATISNSSLPTLVTDKAYFSERNIALNPYHIVKYAEKEFIDIDLETAIASSIVNLKKGPITRVVEVPDFKVSYVLQDGLTLLGDRVVGYINHKEYVDVALEEAIEKELIDVEEECLGMKLETTDEKFASSLIINNDLVIVGAKINSIANEKEQITLERAIDEQLVVVDYVNSEIEKPLYPDELNNIYKQYFIKDGFELSGGKVMGMHENKKYVKLTEENRRLNEPFENKNHIR